MKLKTVRNILIIVIIALFAGTFGFFIGRKGLTVKTGQKLSDLKIENTAAPESKDIDFSLFWDVWQRLETKYVDKSKLKGQDMVYGAISGMVASLGDPYTVFLPPKEQKEAKEELGGSFEGIGAQLGMKDNRIIVVAALKDMPAEAAGIKSGDWIVKVDGTETNGWSVPEAVNKIRGEKGTKVNLTLLHEGGQQTVDLAVVRDTIKVKSVENERTYFEMKDNNLVVNNNCKTCESVAFLKLSRFGDQTNNEWNQAVSDIEKQYKSGEIKGMVLDLRNNPGGYLQGAVYIASEFLDIGKVVVSQEYSDGKKENYSVTREGKLLNLPLVVLINKGSASASEIVAGALRDYSRGKLVGEKSFGKGSIQEAQDLPNGAGLHITIAKWLLPKGDWINGKGVDPDFNIALSDTEPTKDTQLLEAAKLLING